MADEAPTLETLLESGLLLEEEPDGAKLDLEAAIDGWVSDLGGNDDAKIIVYKQKPDSRKQAYIDSFAPQEKSAGDLMHSLRHDYGGGIFVIQLRSAGKIRKRAVIEIEPPPAVPDNGLPFDPVAMLRELRADDKAPNGGDDMTRLIFTMMQSQADNQAKMMTAFAEAIAGNRNDAPPPPTMTELVSALAGIKALDGGGKSEDSINLFIKGVELAKDLNGSTGDTNMMDVLKSSINAFGGTMSEAMAAQAAAPAVAGPARPALAAPGATDPAPIAAPTAPGEAPPMTAEAKKLEPLARMVIGWAEQARDPYTYAGVLIDELGADNAYVWFCTKEGSDTLLSTFPAAQPHTAWLRAVGEAIAEITRPDDDIPPSGHDDPPPDTDSTDAPIGLPDVSTESQEGHAQADTDASAFDGDSSGASGDQNHAAIDGESIEGSEN